MHDVGHTSNLSLSWDKRGIRAVLIMRESRRGKEEIQASSHDLRISVGRFSSGQEQKFITSTRDTCGYLKIGISSKIQEERFREIEVVGFRRLPNPHLEVRDSSYLGLLSIFGLGKEGFLVKGLLGEETLVFRVLPGVSSLSEPQFT